MILRILGDNLNAGIHGFVLSPQEYMDHPAHDSFCLISNDTLFVADDARVVRPRISIITPLFATRFVVVEATDDERARLKAAGYKMVNL